MNSSQNIFNKIEACGMCGAVTVGSRYGVCAACAPKDQEMFEAVKNSIGFNEQISIDEISTKTGVSVKYIKNWIKRGRLAGGSSY